jgi:hypothetical protein
MDLYDYMHLETDKRYQAAAELGQSSVADYLEEELTRARQFGRTHFVFFALYRVILGLRRYPGARDLCLAAAKELLTLPPPDLQQPLYAARCLFIDLDEPGLALDLIQHGYSAIRDAESAFNERNHLIASKKLIFAIQAALDPWSEETGAAMYEATRACAPTNELDDELLDAMTTITNRPTDDWKDAAIQRALLRRVWGSYAGEQEFGFSDCHGRMDRIKQLHNRVPDLPKPYSNSNDPQDRTQ